MSLPAWLQNEGAWIAMGVSVLFVVAALVMHRVVVKVLKQPTQMPELDAFPQPESQPHE
ncbi:hypothetical protein [Hydrogenophaga sp. PAMC20947]|uniref:hypothetical protein n=1 Tax=Hydrogenophaga sp. PAMC20947 TaxID=2565558 RepID=UPI0014484345|nr:hypothetical protein [Hydrogenophaga sp. PAMC20947]